MKCRLVITLVLVLIVFASVVALAAGSYDLSWWTVDSGGWDQQWERLQPQRDPGSAGCGHARHRRGVHTGRRVLARWSGSRATESVIPTTVDQVIKLQPIRRSGWLPFKNPSLSQA